MAVFCFFYSDVSAHPFIQGITLRCFILKIRALFKDKKCFIRVSRHNVKDTLINKPVNDGCVVSRVTVAHLVKLSCLKQGQRRREAE